MTLMKMSLKQNWLALALMASAVLFAGGAVANPVQNEEMIVRHGADNDVYLRNHGYRPFDQGFRCDGHGAGCNNSPNAPSAPAR